MKKTLSNVLGAPAWLYRNLWSEPDPALVILFMFFLVFLVAAFGTTG